jgi:ligand-binding sensor domain-containing protein
MKKHAVFGLMLLFLLNSAQAKAEGIWTTYVCQNWIHQLDVDKTSVWWVSSGDVVRCDKSDGAYTNFTSQIGFCYDVHVDNSGYKWFGTKAGVVRYDGKEWKRYTDADGLAGNTVTVINSDNDGVIWCATDKGISNFDGLTWKSFLPDSLFVIGDIFDIAVDQENVKWFAGRKGLIRFDDQQWKVYPASEKMMDEDHGRGFCAFAMDSQNTKWFGKDTNGLVTLTVKM